jgi:ABC-type transporter Mla subunit MlaD
MEERQRYHRLGLFIVVSLSILFVILFILGGRSLFRPTVMIETYFDQSVAGLEVGAPVNFRGVPLGTVSEILTAAAAYQADIPAAARKSYIVVRAKISGSKVQVTQWKKELGEFIKRGLRARTQIAGITGQQYLALDFSDPERYPRLPFDWTPKYRYIPSAPSLTGQLVGNVQKFLASLNEADIRDLGRNLNRLVETVTEKIDQFPVADLSAEAAGLLKEARGTVQRADRVIARSPIDEAVTNIASASGRLDALLADPKLKATADDAAAITGRLRTIAESGEIDTIVMHLDQTIRRIDAMVGANQYDVRVIIQDLRATADNLRALSETAKRYPAGTLFGGPPAKVELPKEGSK